MEAPFAVESALVKLRDSDLACEVTRSLFDTIRQYRESFDVTGLENGIKPQMDVKLVIHRKDGSIREVPVLLRIDTPIEVDYYRHGGILPFVLRELLGQAA